MKEISKQKRIGRAAGLGLLCGAAFVAAVPLAAMAFVNDNTTGSSTTTSSTTIVDVSVDEDQTRHDCWESTLADTESGSEELRAIADAIDDCGGPWSLLAEIFDVNEDEKDLDDCNWENEDIEDWDLWEDLGWND